MYIISACLLGDNCKYDGGNNRNEDVLKIAEKNEYIKVCPEVLGGLPCPRTPAERAGNRVISCLGEDFTDEFTKGAEKTLEIAENNCVEIAIMKSRSPSCGFGKVYDGTFSGKLKDGSGVTSELLSSRGIRIVTEEELEKLNCDII